MSIPITVARAVHRVPLPTGIVVNVGAASPLYQTEVQRSLSASTSGAKTVARLPGSAQQFTDNLPYDGTARYYRSRAVQDGLKPGQYTPWSPALKPLPITSQVVSAPANSFALSPVIGSPGPAQGSSFGLSTQTLGLLQQIANIDTTQSWYGAVIVTDQAVATTATIYGLFVGAEALQASGTVAGLVGQTINVSAQNNNQTVTNFTGLQCYLEPGNSTTVIGHDTLVTVSGGLVSTMTVCSLVANANAGGTITTLTLLKLNKAAVGGTISGGFAINDTSGLNSVLSASLVVGGPAAGAIGGGGIIYVPNNVGQYSTFDSAGTGRLLIYMDNANPDVVHIRNNQRNAGGTISFEPIGGGSSSWQMLAAGHLVCPTDNTYDIGASNTTRPRNLYLAGAATIGGLLTATGGISIGIAKNIAFTQTRTGDAVNGQLLWDNGTGQNFSLAETASNVWSIGSATNGGVTTAYFSVNTSTGQVTIVSGILSVAASVTGHASLNIPSGTAPTSPADGDMWYDGANVNFRVGGTTKTFTLT